MAGAIKKKEIVEFSPEQLSKELEKIAIAIDKIASSINKIQPPKGLNDLSKATEELTFEEAELARQHQKLGKLQAQLESTEKQRYKDIIKTQEALKLKNKQLREEARASLGVISSFKNLAKSVLSYAAAMLGLQQIIRFFTTTLFNLTKKLDSLHFSMRTVITDSSEYLKTTIFLSRISIAYGQNLLTLTERYIKFRAAAQQSNMSAKETMQIFDSTAKAASVLGLKTDEVNGVFLALEQMISKGKVTTEELRRQLGERLPGAFGIMADALGVSISQLDKMLKAGEVISDEALPKFARALEEAYGITAVTKVDNLAAATGRLSTSWTLFVDSLEASNTYKGIIDFFNTSLNQMLITLDDMKSSKSFRIVFGTLLLSAGQVKSGLKLMNGEVERSDDLLNIYLRTTTKQGDQVKSLVDSYNEFDFNTINSNLEKNKELWIDNLSAAGIGTSKAITLFDQYIKQREKLSSSDEETSEKIKPLDIDSFKKTLLEARDEYERHKLLKDDIVKEEFEDTAAFYKKDQKTYGQYLESKYKELRISAYKAKLIYENSSGEQRDAAYLDYKNRVTAASLTLKELNSIENSIENSTEKSKTRFAAKRFQFYKKIQDEYISAEADRVKKRVDQQVSFLKDEEKRLKENSSIALENLYSDINEETLAIQEKYAEEIKLAKNNKDKIAQIQRDLTKEIIGEEIKRLEAAANTGNIIGKDYETILKRIAKLKIAYSKEDYKDTSKTEEEKQREREEYARATSSLLRSGAEFSSMLFDAQEERAKKTYEAETAAAGENLEQQIIAKRKFEAEDKKIKRRQALASKLQAIFDAGLNLALAISTTWADPFLAAANIAAATLGLGIAVGTPIPAYAEGVESHEGGLAILGDGMGSKAGAELVKEPSGNMWLSSSNPSVYDLPKGSEVLPADETSRRLAQMAFNQVRETVDMSRTNTELRKIAKNTNKKEERYYDNKGNLIVKRGSITSKYACR